MFTEGTDHIHTPSTIPSNLDHSGLFFLSVHRHSTSTVTFPPQESLTTIVDQAINCCDKLNNEVLQRELEQEERREQWVSSREDKSDSNSNAQSPQRELRRRSSSVFSKKHITLTPALKECMEKLTQLEKHLWILRHTMIATRLHPMMTQHSSDDDDDDDDNDNNDDVISNSNSSNSSDNEISFHQECDRQSHLKYDGPVDTIATFNSENRGLLLLVVHTLDDTMQQINELQGKADRRRRSSSSRLFFSTDNYLQNIQNLVAQCSSKVNVILVLIRYAIKIAENRYRYLDHCIRRIQTPAQKDRETVLSCSAADSYIRGPRILSPFADGIDFEHDEDIRKLDYSVLMQEMGSQFMSGVGDFFNVLVRVTAAHNVTATLKNDFIRQGLLGLRHLLYSANTKSASRQVVKFFREASPEHSRMLWETLDTGIVRFFNYLTLSPIPTSRIFYIAGPVPSLMHKCTKFMSHHEFNKCLDCPQETTYNNISSRHQSTLSGDIGELKDVDLLDIRREEGDMNAYANGDDEAIDSHTETHLMHNLGFDGSSTMEEFERYTKDMPLLLAKARTNGNLSERMENIQLRLVAPWGIKNKDLSIKTVEEWKLLSKISRTAGAIGKKIYASHRARSTKMRDGCMILHIHGGGFVSMSSYSHESYVRRWAYRCNVPIISVDYRKAPEHKYPSLIAECYEAYKWSIQNASHIIGQPLKKIIVTGDSAGGNLAMAVCNRAIQDEIRIPDALVLTYPVTMLKSVPSSGRIMSLIDPLVNFNFLKMCCRSYLGDCLHESRTNAYMSPAVTPPEILMQYPPVYMHVGSLDPLLDDAVYVAKRIEKYNGGRVALEIYDGLPHAYLNMVGLVPGASEANMNLMRWMNKFFDIGTENVSASVSDSDSDHDCFDDDEGDDDENK